MSLDARQSAVARARRLLAHDAHAHADEAVVPSIAQTSLFTFDSFAEMSDTFAGKRTRNVYSRTTNPTVSMFERKMAELEETEDAIGFPSGIGHLRHCAGLCRAKGSDGLRSSRLSRRLSFFRDAAQEA